MKVGPAILLAAGVVVSAEAQKQSSSKSLEGMTTEDLRRSTNEFVVANADKIKPIARQRLLRHASKRRERNKGKYDDDEYDDDDWHGGAKWYGGFEDKWGDDWNGHGRSKSGKYSGKGGKSGGDDWYGDDDWHGGNDDLFYMLPSGCGNMCASSRTNGDKELEDSIEICQSGAVDQRWMVRSDDSYVMIESYAHPGKCIATDYTEGDTRSGTSQAGN
ncbi:hypothetical protein THAOC_08491 [Thalassiosira oceanica]|uniref:Uncharacterized protein n=1 Tax=Thalassiosira oceanica TaxID=159749 RepID=K0SUV2_THAOC|nr:hypothetical protein THAOC_08491 [Thalassiosira oceanica]|eukprot:EJK70173.1 hypothetical protein THAOC_08491 [Thalassiosira oceanica]